MDFLHRIWKRGTHKAFTCECVCSMHVPPLVVMYHALENNVACLFHHTSSVICLKDFRIYVLLKFKPSKLYKDRLELSQKIKHNSKFLDKSRNKKRIWSMPKIIIPLTLKSSVFFISMKLSTAKIYL